MEAIASRSSEKTSSVKAKPAALKVLLITDDWMQLELFKSVLPEDEFDVSVLGSDGRGAASFPIPDVILADWDDTIDGKAVAVNLKSSHKDLKDVPAILITDRMVTLTKELARTFTWILEKPIVTTSLPKLLRWTVNSRNVRSYLRAFIQHGSTASGAMLATE